MDSRLSQSVTPLLLSITFDGLNTNNLIFVHGNGKILFLQIKRNKD